MLNDEKYFRFGQTGKSWSESILSAPDQGVFKLRLESQSPKNPAQALASLPADLDIPLSEKISRISEGSMSMEVSSTSTGITYPYTGLTKWSGPRKELALTT